MNYGFIKVAVATCNVKVSDCFYNANSIIQNVKEAYGRKACLLVFPELCLTGYTCGDLFFQTSLLKDSNLALKKVLEETKDFNINFIIGMPVEFENKMFNCGVCIYKGEIKGIVPKSYIPNYNEFYEKRYFNQSFEENKRIEILGQNSIFGKNIIFNIENIENFKFSIEICEDLWGIVPPSSKHILAGAIIIANLSASNETTGKSEYRKELVKGQSARGICGYLYSGSAEGESTTDVVFSCHSLIFENGKCLAESKKFESNILYSDIDVDYLASERRKNTTFSVNNDGYTHISYKMDQVPFEFARNVDKFPFIPNNEIQMENRCKEIIEIQSYGLKKRIEHIGIKNVVVGVSGGLDSTQALIVINRTFEILGYDKKGIIAVTMPCFGTTDRTYNNAKKLCEIIGTTFLEINIKEAVLKHFEDIGQDKNIHDVTYENSQARERTQVLMDIANKYKAIVIGTGDLSELALGFATYNGDHMSMYAVNSSIPKTLMRHLIKYFAQNSEKRLNETLMDILDTPVSPELLPPQETGDIAQITEDIVGPYELHDFFLYHMVRCNFEPEKIYFLAKKAFKDLYEDGILLKWLEKFYTRFFSQQFKRSCMPDGPKVGSVSLSPRGDFRMPSDASVQAFLNRIKKLKA